MSHENKHGTGKCVIKDDTLTSFQAIVIRSNGYKFDPKDIDLDDIDALTNVRDRDAWKEAMAIFGTDGDRIVKPDIKRGFASMLSEKTYTVTKDAMSEMGFKGESISIPGGEFASKELFNCPFGRNNPHSSKCRLTASFKESVDSLTIIYALTQSSRFDPNAAVFFSELMVKCNCRCKLKENKNAVKYHPVPGVDGECTMTQVTRPSLMCDNLGDKMCSHEVSDTWTSDAGAKLPNGNFKCGLGASKVTKLTSDFNPSTSFNMPIAKPLA